MATEFDSLLTAEQAVNELLGKLHELNEQIEGYSGAKATLNEVKKELVHSISRLADLTAASKGALEVARNINESGILERLASVEVAIGKNQAKTAEALASAEAAIKQNQANAVETLTDTRREILKAERAMETAAREATTKTVDALGNTASNVSKALDEARTGVFDRTKTIQDAISQIATKVNAMDAAIRYRLNWLIIAAWFVALSLAAAGVAAIRFLTY